MKSLVRAVVKSFASRASCGLVAAVALWVLTSGQVLALELVPGGYGAVGSEAVPDRTFDGQPGIGRDDAGSGLSLDFTPRYAAGSSWSSTHDEADLGGPRFDFTIDFDPGDRFEQLGLSAGRSTLYPRNRRTGQTSLSVGGAMRWSGWSLGGGYGRSQFMGTDVDLLSASIGYGRLSAALAFGQPAVGSQTAPHDVLMLNTDLAAWSWLTLESGIAVGSVPSAEREDQPVAVGRIGVRLNF
ncbi:hypothetical protein [Benzoatithermus flavus]|uniref:Uncharacterized protein n=1 Tax=Benzoatithermus flavus TaxID=3108223 RepID=A0ABU8XLU7_9PROT